MAKQRIVNPLQGFKAILNEILENHDILYNTDELKTFFPYDDNKACLNMIIPTEFIKKGKSNIYQRLFEADRALLSNFMTGTNANGVLSVREEMAKYISISYNDYVEALPMNSYNKIFCADNICSNFTLQKIPMVYKALTRVPEISISKKNILGIMKPFP